MGDGELQEPSQRGVIENLCACYNKISSVTNGDYLHAKGQASEIHSAGVSRQNGGKKDQKELGWESQHPEKQFFVIV